MVVGEGQREASYGKPLKCRLQKCPIGQVHRYRLSIKTLLMIQLFVEAILNYDMCTQDVDDRQYLNFLHLQIFIKQARLRVHQFN